MGKLFQELQEINPTSKLSYSACGTSLVPMASGPTIREEEAIARYRDIIEGELSQDVINYGDQPGLRAIHVVARAGETNIARQLLQKKADVNFHTSKGLSPLHYAVLSGKVSMVQLLLLYGAKINAQSHRDGRTALYSAAERGDLEIVRTLLENGADPSLKCHNDTLPRDAASQNGWCQIQAVLEDFERRSIPVRSTSSHGLSTNPFPVMPLSRSPTQCDHWRFFYTVPVSTVREEQPAYDDPPPSYDEVMGNSNLFGTTAYSQEEDDEDDTSALLGDSG